MSLWIPGFQRVDLGVGSPDGGYYDEYRHPKFGWHTWEGYNWSAAEAALRPYPPHCAVKWEDYTRRRYLPLERHAYAFAGNDSDDSYVIQVEVAGFAGESHDWPRDKLKWLAEEVVRPITRVVPIPNVIVKYGFHGEGEGFILASRNSPIRLTTAEMDAFSGHLGHQHMPSPDQHWDPGKLPISTILDLAKPLPVEDEEDMGFLFTWPESNRRWYGNWIHYREVTNEDIKDIKATAGGAVKELVLVEAQVKRMERIGA